MPSPDPNACHCDPFHRAARFTVMEERPPLLAVINAPQINKLPELSKAELMTVELTPPPSGDQGEALNKLVEVVEVEVVVPVVVGAVLLVEVVMGWVAEELLDVEVGVIVVATSVSVLLQPPIQRLKLQIKRPIASAIKKSHKNLLFIFTSPPL